MFKALSFFFWLSLMWLLQKWIPHSQIQDVDKKRFVNFCLGLLNLGVAFFLGSITQLLPTHSPSLLEVLSGVLILDFVAYGFHRLFHQFDFLFRFHRVHHSDPHIEFSSALRFHFGEVFVANSGRLLATWSLGFSYKTLVIFEVIFLAFNLFEHSNLRLPEKLSRTLSWLWITPALHRKHHSIQEREMNSNYGTVFSVWDRSFGTWTPGMEKEEFPMGLRAHQEEIGLREALICPFKRQ